MRRKIKKVIPVLLVCTIALFLIMGATATETGGIVKFTVEDLASDGTFDLTMAIYNAKFSSMQFALKYNTAAVQAVDEKGQATDVVKKFAQVNSENNWLSTVGMEMDAATGYFSFASFIMPVEKGVGPVDERGCATAGQDGIEIFRFHFKKIGDTQPGFAIATDKEDGPYNKALPTGAALLNYEGDVPSVIEFNMPEDWGGRHVADIPTYEDLVPGGGKNEQTMTREERLKNTVILQVGNSSAAVEGKLTSIYPDEPSVVAYAHDDRTFVPIRFVAESLKATVGWDNLTQTVSIEKGGHKIAMKVGAETYTLDGQEKSMDVRAELKGEPGNPNQRTMVPIRFVAEALDMDVQWDVASNAIVLAPKAVPWNLSGTMEKEILSDALLMLSPLV